MTVELQVQQFIDFIRDEMPRRIKTNPNSLPDAQKLLVSVSGTLEVIYKTLAELDIAIKSDVDTELSNKEPTITAGTSEQYFRGDKTWQTLNTDAVSESTNKRYLNDAQKVIATQAASSTVNGYLSSADWSTFNSKQAALADVITADTYGNSTQYPVITFNAKGIATGVTLQTPTFTDANFSVQKNGSPSIAASWSLTALTASRVHTYPDKDIDFKTLSSIGASDGNTLSGTRTRIVGGSNNNVSGTDNVAIGCNYVKMTGSSNTAMSCAGSSLSAQATEFAGTGNTFTSCSGYILGTGCTLVSYSGFTYYANLRAAYNALVVPRHSSVVFNTFSELSITSGVYGNSNASSGVLVDADGIKPVMWIDKSFGDEVSEHIVRIKASAGASVFYGERKVLYKAGDGGTPLVTTIGTDFGTYGMELTVSIVITATGTGNKDMSITVQNGAALTSWSAKIESTHF